jgi:hypothetical protein
MEEIKGKSAMEGRVYKERNDTKEGDTKEGRKDIKEGRKGPEES